MKSPFKYLLREEQVAQKWREKQKREERREKRKSTSLRQKRKKEKREKSKKRTSLSSLDSLLSSLLSSFWFLGLFPLGIVFFPTDALFLFTLYLYLLYLSFEKQQARALLSLSLKGGTNSTQIRKEQRAAVKEWRTTRRFNSSRTTSS